MSGVWLGQEPCVTGDKAQLSGLTADAVNLGEKAVSDLLVWRLWSKVGRML